MDRKPRFVLYRSVTDMPGHFKDQALSIILTGDQVSKPNVNRGLKNAKTIALYIEGEDVVSVACLKTPLESYRRRIFLQEAKSTDNIDLFPLELGYIATHQDHENKKHCQGLLAHLFPTIAKENMFATTRKPSMVHILSKFGFVKSGIAYKEDLILMIYQASQPEITITPG